MHAVSFATSETSLQRSEYVARKVCVVRLQFKIFCQHASPGFKLLWDYFWGDDDLSDAITDDDMLPDWVERNGVFTSQPALMMPCLHGARKSGIV
jgi:hypothetical protein